uniref:carbonic anhydrase n=1 Tax=Candidatus Kentrum sp. MB TaxID=2138164 RepID=A0A450XNX8_9GAMM|nr:MAG: carbonic anhydrase [Candidatus Kentron sp. MB]VFK34379.1 MAG: carbonic anhydrase [Candidatus Kentron sp. MB]VFK76484.1 MAG: carbonic anhydrase [Candidatus Kentron sp. MB]
MKTKSSIIAFGAAVALALGNLSYAGHGHKHSWQYEGEHGPEHWGKVSAVCGSGKTQSPIDIKGQTKTGAPSLDMQYHPVPSINVLNNGHTIKGSFGGEKNRLLVDGKPYKLLQLHFHTPSEHQIGGKLASMELHLVHQNADKELAVIGIMIEEGKENKAIKGIWEKMPKKVAKETESHETFNVASLLPKDKTFFYYMGSLTTPPCSEGVRWFVMKTPIHFSEEQIRKFHRIIGVSNRPLQPLNGRTIFQGK